MSWSMVSFASWSTVLLPAMPQLFDTQQMPTQVPLTLNIKRRFMIWQMRFFQYLLWSGQIHVGHYVPGCPWRHEFPGINAQTSSTDVPPTLHWRHNDHHGVSNHQPHGCLLNRLFRRRSKKTPKLRVTGLCVGNSPGPVSSPQKWPVTRKMFPFDDVIMWRVCCRFLCCHRWCQC